MKNTWENKVTNRNSNEHIQKCKNNKKRMWKLIKWSIGLIRAYLELEENFKL